jgi:pyrroloquinoline quinone (PQQ) biosynthesis protein C
MEIRELLGESVDDEMGKTEVSPIDHYSCYFDLVDELGIPRQEVGNPELLSPEAMMVMYVWTTSALQLSLLEILSSHNFVNDVANVLGYPKVAQALTTHYNLSDKAVRWFSLHGEVDVEHGRRSREVLARIIKTEDDEFVVRQAVRLGLGVKWTLFDGVMNRYVNGSNPIRK